MGNTQIATLAPKTPPQSPRGPPCTGTASAQPCVKAVLHRYCALYTVFRARFLPFTHGLFVTRTRFRVGEWATYDIAGRNNDKRETAAAAAPTPIPTSSTTAATAASTAATAARRLYTVVKKGGIAVGYQSPADLLNFVSRASVQQQQRH